MKTVQLVLLCSLIKLSFSKIEEVCNVENLVASAKKISASSERSLR